MMTVDRAHFKECLLETLEEMFGSECTEKVFQRDRLTVMVDDKQAVINLDTLVTAFVFVVIVKF